MREGATWFVMLTVLGDIAAPGGFGQHRVEGHPG
jgi:hypothetical protein